MDEEIYYVPDFNDFMIGMEYEARNDYFDWEPFVFGYTPYPIQKGLTDAQSDQSERYDEPETIYNMILGGDIRVKYLSKECIEELGWVKARSDKNREGRIISETYEILYEKENEVQTKFTLFWLLGDYNFIAITERSFINDREADVQNIYSGKCYNKSELRWIMDRLGINTEK